MAASTVSALTSTDLDHLQGEWLTIEGRRAGELFISGRTYSLRFLDGTSYQGTFELHAAVPASEAAPRHMLMHIEEGPPKHRGKSAWCIYSLEVGQLRWCPGEPGSAEKLTAFPDLEDRRFLNTVFRRDIMEAD